MKSIRSFSALTLLLVLSISQASAFTTPAFVGKARDFVTNQYASLYFRAAVAKQVIKNADYKGFAQKAVASKTSKVALGAAVASALGYGIYKAVNYFKANKKA